MIDAGVRGALNSRPACGEMRRPPVKQDRDNEQTKRSTTKDWHAILKEGEDIMVSCGKIHVCFFLHRSLTLVS
jgi:hypothetical protein